MSYKKNMFILDMQFMASSMERYFREEWGDEESTLEEFKMFLNEKLKCIEKYAIGFREDKSVI